MHLKIHFLLRLKSDLNEISMANANIDALYVGNLRIKISHFFPSNFTFYKWCVTKVAHCTDRIENFGLFFLQSQNFRINELMVCTGICGSLLSCEAHSIFHL